MITAEVPCDSAASGMRESVGAVFRVGRPSVRLETDALNPLAYGVNLEVRFPHILGDWCNGSTSDSGSLSLGSNPRSPA
jgi:hypothetical protein